MTRTKYSYVYPVLLLIGSLIVGGCDSGMRTSSGELSLKWEVVANGYDDKNQFLSELTITNNGTELQENNWELFFSFSPCRAVKSDQLPTTFEINHIAGDFHRMIPTQEFAGIKAGASTVIPIVASDWAIKPTDGPGGFYFIFDKNDTDPISVKVEIEPFTRPEQSSRSTWDAMSQPTPASRFEANERLNLLESSALSPITPTPQFLQKSEGYFSLTKETVIVVDPAFENEAKFLQTAIEENLGAKLSIVGESNNSNRIEIVQAQGLLSEGYGLTVNNDGVSIQANANAGAMHAIQSLRQLLPIESYGKASSELSIPNLTINDAPRFPYRGMHLDVGRNFQSKESVLQLLDMMSFYKLNKFHFHITDDEGWRLEIKGLPELTEIGSKRGHTRDESDVLYPQYGSGADPDHPESTGSGYYTIADFIEILRYATDRHIEVIPEIDMPGHAHAAIKAMDARYYSLIETDKTAAEEFLLSDLNDASEYSSVQRFSDNVICVCQNSTYAFLEKVTDEIITMFEEANAPLTTIHTGGDEVPHGVWEKSPVCNALMQSDDALNDVNDLKAYFIGRFSDLLLERKLATAGWEEIALHLEPTDEGEIKTVNPDYLDKRLIPFVWNSVFGWGGDELGYQLANAGYPTVLCNVTNLYLDMANDNSPNEPGFYWGGFVTNEHPYFFKPFDVYDGFKTDNSGNKIPADAVTNKVPLTKKGKQNILGIQGQLWSETIKSQDLMEYMIYPRIITLAERAWSEAPTWDYLDDAYAVAWNEMANRLGQRELLRLSTIDSGMKFRVPKPGAIVKEGVLHVNSSLPGLVIRYTTDGSEPNMSSKVYDGPVEIDTDIVLKAFSGPVESESVRLQ